MAQRQVRKHSVILANAKQLSGMAGGKAEIAEVMHHPFRRASGAGGVDDGGELIGSRLGVVLNRRAGLQVIPGKAELALRAQRQADGRHILRHTGGH